MHWEAGGKVAPLYGGLLLVPCTSGRQVAPDNRLERPEDGSLSPAAGDATAPAAQTPELGPEPPPVFHCGEGNGNPLQYSCLENPRDRGA